MPHLFMAPMRLLLGCPDCRPAFIEQFERLANVATATVDDCDHWSVEAPLISMSKSTLSQLVHHLVLITA